MQSDGQAGVPQTISDDKWASIVDGAFKANPALNSDTSTEAVKRQKDGARQHEQRQWS